MEMFSQCSRAQQYLDEFNKDQGYSFATIECSDNIVCADYNNLDSAYWCQNMDAYNICKSVQRILENFTKYPVECNYELVSTDQIPIINYYRAPAQKSSSASKTTFALTLLWLVIIMVMYNVVV